MIVGVSTRLHLLVVMVLLTIIRYGQVAHLQSTLVQLVYKISVCLEHFWSDLLSRFACWLKRLLTDNVVAAAKANGIRLIVTLWAPWGFLLISSHQNLIDILGPITGTNRTYFLLRSIPEPDYPTQVRLRWYGCIRKTDPWLQLPRSLLHRYKSDCI